MIAELRCDRNARVREELRLPRKRRQTGSGIFLIRDFREARSCRPSTWIIFLITRHGGIWFKGSKLERLRFWGLSHFLWILI